MELKFAILAPRPTPEAAAVNGKIFKQGEVWGIEVTIPALAARLRGNIDPQHTDGRTDRAAIEEALEFMGPYWWYTGQDGGPRPPEWGPGILATVRPDLDSVGAMAVIDAKLDGVDLVPAARRIAAIAAADKFARGPWPGERPLPTKVNPWSVEGGATETRDLAAIAAAVADFKVSIEERVGLMRCWLLTGAEPPDYRVRAEAERADMIRALETGDILVARAGFCRSCNREFGFGANRNQNWCPQCGGGDVNSLPIAIVHGSHRAATMVGYSYAPTVIAFNPSFRIGGGDPHAKYTVAQYTTEHVDLENVLAELAEREPGWGGSPTIGGSPQGGSSTLGLDEVVAAVARHLK